MTADPISPHHYRALDPEPRDVLLSWVARHPGDVAAEIYAAMQYLVRCGMKPDNSLLQDLRKARDYLDHLISRLSDPPSSDR